jgi:hypothetical protein
MQPRRAEQSVEEHHAAPAPITSDDHRRRRRRKKVPQEPDSREAPRTGSEEPGLRLEPETIKVDVEPSGPTAERETQQLREEILALRETFEHLKGLNTALRDRIRRWDEKAEALNETRVFARCGTKGRTLLWNQNQKWASMRKRLIRTFKLKDSYWELEEKRFETVGDDGWRIVLPPLDQPGRDMEYRIVRIRRRRRRAPGMSDWSRITHGRPGNEWKVGYQRQGGPATIGSAPRPNGAPPWSADGPNAGGVGRRGAVSLMDR